jgi:hypothetical protein
VSAVAAHQARVPGNVSSQNIRELLSRPSGRAAAPAVIEMLGGLLAWARAATQSRRAQRDTTGELVQCSIIQQRTYLCSVSNGQRLQAETFRPPALVEIQHQPTITAAARHAISGRSGCIARYTTRDHN